jgi:drug/metabolite transporter (DMT)-like permease
MESKINKKMWGTYLLLFLAQVMVSTNIVGSKFLVESMPLLFLLAIRFSLAAILLLPLHWLLDKNKNSIKVLFSKLNKRDWAIITLQALFAGVCFNLLMVFGLRFTDANLAGIIASTLPAIIAILAWIILKERFTSKKALCVGLATLGLLAISINNFTVVEFEHSYIGDFLIFIALLPEAAYYVLTKLNYHRLPIYLMSSIMNGINAIILLPLMFLFVDFSLISISAIQGVILIIVGLSAGLFYVFWFLGSANVDSTMGALSTAVMPLITVVIAWLTLGETITLIQLVGMTLVIGSIVAYARA